MAYGCIQRMVKTEPFDKIKKISQCMHLTFIKLQNLFEVRLHTKARLKDFVEIDIAL